MQTQMTDAWIKSAATRLRQSGDVASIRTADFVDAALESGKLVKVVSGVNQNGMSIVKLK